MVQNEGYIKINYIKDQIVLVASASNFFRSFSTNLFGKCLRPLGYVVAGQDYAAGLDKINAPFKRYIAFRLILTLNRDYYFFDESTSRLDTYFRIIKQVYMWPDKNFQHIQDYFHKDQRTTILSSENLKKIKNFNNYDKMVEDAKIEDVVQFSEHASFLYDNQNLIRETFISETNKKVHLIGSISFFDKVGANDEMSLIKNKNKLKFDFKKKR